MSVGSVAEFQVRGIEDAARRAALATPEVRIVPWIGPEYGRRSRILVLGESQYDPKRQEHTEDEIRFWNVRFVGTYAYGNKGAFFLTKVARALKCDGRYWAGSERATFLELAYYNFVQDMIPRGTIANDFEIKRSTAALDVVLRALKPELIISFGQKRVASYLRAYCAAFEPTSMPTIGTDAPAIIGGATVVNLPHPASQFSYEAAFTAMRTQHPI